MQKIGNAAYQQAGPTDPGQAGGFGGQAGPQPGQQNRSDDDDVVDGEFTEA
jgi:hypothetical protein